MQGIRTIGHVNNTRDVNVIKTMNKGESVLFPLDDANAVRGFRNVMNQLMHVHRNDLTLVMVVHYDEDNKDLWLLREDSRKWINHVIAKLEGEEDAEEGLYEDFTPSERNASMALLKANAIELYWAEVYKNPRVVG